MNQGTGFIRDTISLAAELAMERGDWRAFERADSGLKDWTAEPLDDEGLVELSGGTAVRWVEGQGWVKESAFVTEES